MSETCQTPTTITTHHDDRAEVLLHLWSAIKLCASHLKSHLLLQSWTQWGAVGYCNHRGDETHTQIHTQTFHHRWCLRKGQLCKGIGPYMMRLSVVWLRIKGTTAHTPSSRRACAGANYLHVQHNRRPSPSLETPWSATAPTFHTATTPSLNSHHHSAPYNHHIFIHHILYLSTKYISI